MTTIASIIAAVAARHQLKPEQIIAQDRHRQLARPRMEAYWLARQVTDKSLPELGRVFKRHHTTVLHGIRAVEAMASVEHKAWLLQVGRGIDTTDRAQIAALGKVTA